MNDYKFVESVQYTLLIINKYGLANVYEILYSLTSRKQIVNKHLIQSNATACSLDMQGIIAVTAV
jgi:hypothetical protein